MQATLRRPAVAGRFYPEDPASLLAEVHSYLPEGKQAPPAIGCIAPHAGYMYSGHVAGAVYAEIKVPASCIVMCPNHTGYGKPLSIMSEGQWETPLGRVPINTALASELKQQCSLLEEDTAAHRGEHAIEVQLPFLQAGQSGLSFVPIALGTGRFEDLSELGEALGAVVSRQTEQPLIVASSDMNHYEPDRETRVKDHMAIEPILALDARGLWEVVHRENISMCGFGPAVAMLTAAKKLGAAKATLVKYATSGDVSGDRNLVVGYAGVVVR
jgi:AmmeMemoRadiSam system protein B